MKISRENRGKELEGLVVALSSNHAEHFEGFAFSGLVNSFRESRGISFSGLLGNVGESSGMHVGGVVVGNDYQTLSGLYVAGGMVHTSTFYGVSFSGIATRVATKNFGINLSGVLNVGKKSKGLRIAGFANGSESTSGVDIAGGINVTSELLRGLQIAALNFSRDYVYGSQIGLGNGAQKLRGVQIGLYNVCGEDSRGVQIGVLNRREGTHWYKGITLGFAIRDTYKKPLKTSE